MNRAAVRFLSLFGIFALGAGAQSGAALRDSAIIFDSGSTNMLGYKIEVFSDGSASLTTQSATSTPSSSKSLHLPLETVKQFFADLAAARKANATTVPCMKSASFGTTIRVTWQGWTSPDLTCPAKDSLGAALVKDVDAIRAASGVNAPRLRNGPVEVESPSPP